MRSFIYRSVGGIGVALFPLVANAGPLEEAQTLVVKGLLYGLLLVLIVTGLLVFFMRWRDKRAAPLNRIFEQRTPIHSVGPDTLVTDCVRTMAAEKIGAVIVMDGEQLKGIFTERDALNRVLAAGLDPRSTRVSEVMTKDPYCIPPTMTVGAAMQLVTQRRFRHLPIVQDGKVLNVISSGDLTHWLVKDQVGEAQELIELPARY